MSDETSTGLPEIADPAAYMEHLTFHPELPVGDVPAFDADDELVPRSYKPTRRLDNALQQIAERRGISKSELMREYLEAAVLAELSGDGEAEVLIPLSEALRALTGLRHLPRTA